MPVVNVNVWEGWGAEKAKAAIEGRTQDLVDLGIPGHAVDVFVHELPMSHWGIGGQPASERFGRAPGEGERAGAQAVPARRPPSGWKEA